MTYCSEVFTVSGVEKKNKRESGANPGIVIGCGGCQPLLDGGAQ